MSDPARDAVFECHGKMKPITHDVIGEVCAFLCKKCGVWRHSWPVAETQKRALAESYMRRLLAERFK